MLPLVCEEATEEGRRDAAELGGRVLPVIDPAGDELSVGDRNVDGGLRCRSSERAA